MPSQVLQKHCIATKRKRLHIRPSLATPLPEADSSESVATSFDLEEIPSPTRRTRSIRIQKGYVWGDDSDQME